MHKPSKPEMQNDALHAARSKVIDAFAKLELACHFLMDCAAIDDNGSTLGTKIAALVSLVPSDAFSIERCERTRLLLTRFPELLDIRNSIVHAPMQISRGSNGCLEAAFFNQKRMTNGSYFVVKLQASGLERVADIVCRLANDLTEPQVFKPLATPEGSIWQTIQATQQRAAGLN